MRVYLASSKEGVLAFQGDCIVATANPGCVGGGALDEALNKKAGAGMIQERKRLPIQEKPFSRCPPGQAVLTQGHALSVDWVIHTVGPNYHHDQMSEADARATLQRCYGNIADICRRQTINSVALAVVSGGQYRAKKSKSLVMDIMCQEVRKHFCEKPLKTSGNLGSDSSAEIFLVVWDKLDKKPLSLSARKYFSGIGWQRILSLY